MSNMTYKELYDEYLDEIYSDIIKWDDLPSWVTGGKSPSSLLEDNDPIMYRCGFSDWTDGLRHGAVCCNECKRRITDFDVGMEDEVLCTVCKGEQFECPTCLELFDVGLGETDEDGDVLCQKCYHSVYLTPEQEGHIEE